MSAQAEALARQMAMRDMLQPEYMRGLLPYAEAIIVAREALRDCQRTLDKAFLIASDRRQSLRMAKAGLAQLDALIPAPEVEGPEHA